MISVVVTARPSFAKLQPLIAELKWREEIEIIACASALLTRYGAIVDQIRQDFPLVPLTTISSTLEGASLNTTAKDTGVLLASLADHFAHIEPRLVVVMADRYETLAVSMAAAYQNIPVAHLQGGERSGGIDDRVRDANTQLATYHFPSTARAAIRLLGLTNGSKHIYNYGCPSIDLARAAAEDPPLTVQELGGVGSAIDLNRPFLLLLQHPNSEDPTQAYHEMWETLTACCIIPQPLLALWPGHGAGTEAAAKALRIFALAHPSYPLHMVRTIPPQRFMRLLRQTSCLVGNSSAGIRECSYLGTPVVNIGLRQQHREQASNVFDISAHAEYLQEAVLRQSQQPFFTSSSLYGDGTAAPRIAAKLVELSS